MILLKNFNDLSNNRYKVFYTIDDLIHYINFVLEISTNEDIIRDSFKNNNCSVYRISDTNVEIKIMNVSVYSSPIVNTIESVYGC